MKQKIKCPHCHKIALKEACAITRAGKIGAPIYCGRKCSGLAGRKNKTVAQKKLEK